MINLSRFIFNNDVRCFKGDFEFIRPFPTLYAYNF